MTRSVSASIRRFPAIVSAVVLLGACLWAATPAAAYSILHSFAGSDGRLPITSLILDGAGYLYGTTVFGGGPSDLGTVFKMKTDGTGFTILHRFVGGPSDGAAPEASLILDDGNLYGTTYVGGSADRGTVFTLATDGTGFSLLHSFAGGAADGRWPRASLILDGAGNLYGTTVQGGASDRGTIFKVKTDGTGFTLLHSFAGYPSDGDDPRAALILDGAGNLYGTTQRGGASYGGTVFTLATDGTGFTLLHSFAGSDGQSPDALILDDDGNLYGVTKSAGSPACRGFGCGNIFTLATDGTGFTILHTFAGFPSDGERPEAGLILDDGNLYGTTFQGGSRGGGTIFTLATDGTGYTILHSFAGGAADGAFPTASLILDGAGNLYGTTEGGGSANRGTVFVLPMK